jgi:hypothetical protein
MGSDRWVGQSLVDSRRSRWRSAEQQYSFGGMSERWRSVSANRQKAWFCVSLECVECAFPWCTARPCSSVALEGWGMGSDPEGWGCREGAEALNEGTESNALGLRSSSHGMLDKADLSDHVDGL